MQSVSSQWICKVKLDLHYKMDFSSNTIINAVNTNCPRQQRIQTYITFIHLIWNFTHVASSHRTSVVHIVYLRGCVYYNTIRIWHNEFDFIRISVHCWALLYVISYNILFDWFKFDGIAFSCQLKNSFTRWIYSQNAWRKTNWNTEDFVKLEVKYYDVISWWFLNNRLIQDTDLWIKIFQFDILLNNF